MPFYRHFTLPRDTWPLVAFDVQTYLQSCIQTYRGNRQRNNTYRHQLLLSFYDSFVDKIFQSRMLQKEENSKNLRWRWTKTSDFILNSSFVSFVKNSFIFLTAFDNRSWILYLENHWIRVDNCVNDIYKNLKIENLFANIDCFFF